MGAKETKQVDSEYFEKDKISFHINILVCGDYNEKFIEKDLQNVANITQEEGVTYIKTGIHNNMKDWNYFFFEKNTDIGKNTLAFIMEKSSKKDYKNLILFYSGLNNYTYKNLLEFYDNQFGVYHVNTIIITKRNEEFTIPSLKKFNPNLIRNVGEDDIIEQQINIIEITSYCNELGDEIGFPKRFVDDKLIDKDSELMIKHSFTFNILVCGRPGCGKSLLINCILGKLKCFSGKGTSSLTNHVVKYIHDKLPLIIYDTPGFEKQEDILRVTNLVKDKNLNLEEEKNKIHCVFYCMNSMRERCFSDDEFVFINFLLEQNMDIYFIATHAGTEEKAADFIGATQLSLLQKSDNNEGIKKLAKKPIFPVELVNDQNYKKFGLKKLFSNLYDNYKNYIIETQITKGNINSINSPFLGEIKSKEDVKKRLTALARRVKYNFKILASTMGQSYDVKGTTMISTAVIKIISKIYNHPITTQDCLKYIKDNGYTNELAGEDTTARKVEKGFASWFYKNGPAAKEVDYLAECLIIDYNKEIDDETKFFEYLNNYKDGIKEAIESLKKIED